jgi:hypothetical protein
MLRQEHSKTLSLMQQEIIQQQLLLEQFLAPVILVVELQMPTQQHQFN